MTSEHLVLDHLVLGVPDLDAAARELLADHGLVALPGGRHPRWGTANRIVPLGACYLELVAVAEPDVAAANAFGSWVADMAAGRSGWGWSVRTHDVTATAARLGLVTEPGSRETPTGERLTWQLAGVPAEGTDRTLPFFIEWGPGTPLPGAAPVEHPRSGVRLDHVEVETEPGALARWLAGAQLPVLPLQGSRGVVAVELASDDGVIRLGPSA